jgi:hypothetical protein
MQANTIHTLIKSSGAGEWIHESRSNNIARQVHELNHTLEDYSGVAAGMTAVETAPAKPTKPTFVG